MNIEQLQQLFSGLPESFIHEMKSKDFKTCWYGSSYLDKRPMELLDHSHPDALTDEKVDVFFYTDIDFFFLKNRIYTERFSGEILFFNSLICKFNLSFEDQKDYILNGNLICANLSLNNKKFIPNVTDGIIENKYKEKSELKLKFEEFWEIIEQLYPESLINEDYEFFQKNILLSDLNDLLCHLGLGIKKEEIKIVKDFIELKHQKSKKPELMDFDFSNYTFNAAIVKHKRVDGEPFYTFYIDIDDNTFEQLLISNKIKIDFAAHWGGCAGPGPRLIGNLGCRYFLGDVAHIEQAALNTVNCQPKRLGQFKWRPENNVRDFWEFEYFF